MKALAALGLSLNKAASVRPDAQLRGELLFEITSEDLGAVHLGRLLDGQDAGRLVALRGLAGAPSAELVSAVGVSRALAQPQLAKVLGITRSGDAWYVASEYISGVTLSDLGRELVSRGTPLAVPIAVRIVLDALSAAIDAQRLLLERAKLDAVRCVFPECIWVADFGETFISEVAIAPLLVRARVNDDASTARSARAIVASADAISAGGELARLVCGSSLMDGLRSGAVWQLPTELIEVIVKAIGEHGVSGYETLQDFRAALSALGAQAIADEAEVSREVRRVMGSVLEQRRARFDTLQRADRGSLPGEEDETASFAATALAQQPARAPSSNPAERHSSERLVGARVELLDEPTAVLARPRVGAPADEPDAGELPTLKRALPEASLDHDDPTLVDVIEPQTDPDLDPEVLESMGRRTRPNVLVPRAKPLPPLAAVARRKAQKASAPREGERAAWQRVAASDVAFYLGVVALLAGALYAIWLARHGGTHGVPAWLRTLSARWQRFLG